MNLHRTNDIPDWSVTPRHKHNFWQRIAARTNGVGTPGNVLSIVGFCLVLFGLFIVVTSSLWQGTVVITIGRCADLLDGIIAHYTGTKSPLGRAVDATLDKIGALTALAVFATHMVLPVWIAASILLQNLANIFISVYAPWKKLFLNPSEPGKIATAGFWATIIAFVTARLVATSHLSNWHYPILFAAYIIGVSSLVLGIYASGGYMLAVLNAPPRKR